MEYARQRQFQLRNARWRHRKRNHHHGINRQVAMQPAALRHDELQRHQDTLAPEYLSRQRA
jgi:hypothetical protein